MNSVLELHPLCTLFPRLSGSEFDALRNDIKANGLRQPIVLHEGMILDGGNRYRACIEAGVEPIIEQFGGGNLVSFVLSANLHRRHMTAGQQAAIVASAQDWAKAQTRGGDRKSDQSAILHLDTAEKRAAESGSSLRTQKMADKVAKADPELAKKVAHGETSLPEAVEKITGKRPGKPRPTLTHDPESVPSKDDELAEAQHTITDLATENEVLRDRLAVEMMDVSEDEKTQAAQILRGLREQVRVLEQENDALKVSRDTYMSKVAEMQKQVNFWRRKAEKVAA